MKGFIHIGKKKYNFVFDTEAHLVHLFKKATDTKPKMTKSIANGEFVGIISGQQLVNERKFGIH